jgi:hypothetical protein
MFAPTWPTCRFRLVINSLSLSCVRPRKTGGSFGWIQLCNTLDFVGLWVSEISFITTRWSTTLLSIVTFLTQFTLRPHLVQIWSRYARTFEPTKPSISTEWMWITDCRARCTGRQMPGNGPQEGPWRWAYGTGKDVVGKVR